MKGLQTLLERFWVVREQDQELFYAVRKSFPAFRRFLAEQVGWICVSNEAVIKLEKIPPRSAPWMGIQQFTDPMDYCLFCGLLIYLEDCEDGEQFLLSALTEAIQAYLSADLPVDWTRFPHRKSLVRVLQFAEKMGMLLVYDGTSEAFGLTESQEVLYENTGLSRNFAIHFDRDISAYRSVEDFEAHAWSGDTERGRQRSQRVYQQLLLCPALYWSESDCADFEYVKNQRPWVAKNLQEMTCGELEIHRNGAFLIPDEQESFGACYPNDQSICDVALLLCGQLRRGVEDGTLTREADDGVVLSSWEFRRQLRLCRDQWSALWSKRLREESPEELERELKAYLATWYLMEERQDLLYVYPAAGRWTGRYPKDSLRQKGAETDESLEDA